MRTFNVEDVVLSPVTLYLVWLFHVHTENYTRVSLYCYPKRVASVSMLCLGEACPKHSNAQRVVTRVRGRITIRVRIRATMGLPALGGYREAGPWNRGRL